MLKDFLEDIRKIYTEIVKGSNPGIEEFKKKWDIVNGIGDRYQSLWKKENRKDTGSFYTPSEIVDFMVDEMILRVDYTKNPYIKIIDPSCGGGCFLISLYERLYNMAIDAKIENPARHVIMNNIYGYDIDENAIMITTIELYDRSGYYSKNIVHGDFLKDDTGNFDVVIGNPPYMGHKVLKGDYRKSLYSMYGDVFSDKGDISYCFIKKSIDSLNQNGVLCFFTSRYMLEALNGENIRRYLMKSGQVERIIDFYGVRVIKGVGVDNIILEFKKGCCGEAIDYYRLKGDAAGKGRDVFEDIRGQKREFKRDYKGQLSTYIGVNSKDLADEGWSFLSPIEKRVIDKIKGLELSTICESYQGIITGCDDAFVLSMEDAEKLKIEKELLKPWIKNKNVERFRVSNGNEMLIYSNIIEDEENYKNAISYIGRHRERLEKRRECLNGKRKWYHLQWGRDREIFEGKKIIFPYKASSNRFAIDEVSYFSADVYAIRINPIFERAFSYEFLVGVLNSSIYEFYVKTMAKKLGDNLYEYYPNKIMHLLIPDYIEEIEREVTSGGEDLRERIDCILNEHLGINSKEYSMIRSWCM